MSPRLLRAALCAATAVVVVGSGVTAAAASGRVDPTNGAAAKAQAVSPALVAPAVVATPPQSVYTAVTPCRIVDTRSGGGTIAAGATRSFAVRGTTAFPAQGGTAGGCGVPETATAITANVTTTGATGLGYLVGFAAGGSAPLANFMTFHKGVNETSNPTLTLAASGEPSLAVKTGPASGTQVIIDVTGYYDVQIHGVLNPGGGIYAATPHIVASTKLGTGSYRVQVDRSLTGCTPIASIHGSSYFASSYISGGYVYANTYDPTGATVDLYWTLEVLC